MPLCGINLLKEGIVKKHLASDPKWPLREEKIRVLACEAMLLQS
jgi:hypothetical protein